MHASRAASSSLPVAARLAGYASERGNPGLIVFAIDTELLGHWWWEGPVWLQEVLATAASSTGSSCVTLGRGAASATRPSERPLRRSSWGEGKDLRTWDSPAVADMAWAARRLELRVLRGLSAAVSRGPPRSARRASCSACRRATGPSSTSARQAGDYAWQRSTGHARALLEAINSSARHPNRGCGTWRQT